MVFTNLRKTQLGKVEISYCWFNISPIKMQQSYNLNNFIKRLLNRHSYKNKRVNSNTIGYLFGHNNLLQQEALDMVWKKLD